jgi:hypothetical protein
MVWDCLWIAAADGPFVHPQVIYEYGEPRCNNIDGEKPKNSEKNLSHFHFVHHKFHLDWPGSEPGPPRLEAGD